MPTTYVLKDTHGNIWYLTTPQGQIVDSVIAPNHAEAALAVQHLVPRDGVWEDREDGQYIHHAPGRSDYSRVLCGDDPVVDRRQPGQAWQSPSTKLRQMPVVVVLQRMPVPVLAIDEDGFILFANAAFTAMVGYTLDSILRLKFHQIVRNLPIGAPAATTMRAYGDQLVELAHHDGSTVLASMSKSAMLRYDDGVALVTFHDLTEKLWSDGQCGTVPAAWSVTQAVR